MNNRVAITVHEYIYIIRRWSMNVELKWRSTMRQRKRHKEKSFGKFHKHLQNKSRPTTTKFALSDFFLYIYSTGRRSSIIRWGGSISARVYKQEKVARRRTNWPWLFYIVRRTSKTFARGIIWGKRELRWRLCNNKLGFSSLRETITNYWRSTLFLLIIASPHSIIQLIFFFHPKQRWLFGNLKQD